MKIKNIIIITLILILSISTLSCSVLQSFFGDTVSSSALFCVLPAEIAEELAPSGLDGDELDNVEDPNDDPSETDDGLNSAVFMAGIVATAASQGADLFNAVVKELSNVENLFEDEIFFAYEKKGKYYGVKVKNQSKTCHITYGKVSSKNDKNFSKGDALTKFVYDPRKQGSGPNMSILMDEYGLSNKSKSNGARYIQLDIANSSSTQTVGVKAFVEGNEAKYFESLGGKITYKKSSKLYEVEGIIKGHPLQSASDLNPKFRVFGVMNNSNEGAISAKLEDFGLQYTLSKTQILDSIGLSDPAQFFNPTFTCTASLDYQVRNYVSMSGSPKLQNVRVKGTKLELTQAVASVDSISGSGNGSSQIINMIPSSELDLTSALSSVLSMDMRSESSQKFYDNITNNGAWINYSMKDSNLPTKNTFGEIYD